MDRNLWRALAGNFANIPSVGDEVYYFAQGHLELAAQTPSISQSVYSNPTVKCVVTHSDLYADDLTDEICIKFNLLPMRRGDEGSRFRRSDANAVEKIDFAVFAKILTSSDANNGGGFSVPRMCADSIFPPLNYLDDPPVQTLSVTDVHGTVWNFRHIFRGTPRRHLLTTGWSKFVNHKKLVAGDAVVFVKNLRGEMFVGIRRASSSKAMTRGDCSGRWNANFSGVRYSVDEGRYGGGGGGGDGGRQVFSRRSIGKLPTEAVANAVELAAQYKPFEVVYYPRAGCSEFIVGVEKVNRALNNQWYAGLRVKMATDADESSKATWYQGTLTRITIPDNKPWKVSPWRMLEVTWDETDALRGVKHMNPWEVEFAAPTPMQPPPLHAAKRFKGLLESGELNDEAELFSPSMRFDDSTMEQFNQSLLSFNSFPAGMQGARQNLFRESRLFNPYEQITPLTRDENSMYNLSAARKTQLVSTELLIGSVQSHTLSPDSQASVLSFATGTAENQICNPTKAEINSFQLFGKVIHVNPPVEIGVDNDVSTSTNDGDEKES